MLAFLSRLVARLQSWEPAWFRKNSWVNESLVAIVATVGLFRLGLGRFLVVVIFNALSYGYERFVDPSRMEPGHNPIDDIGQRAAGCLAAVWVYGLLF